ncbi:hypothetical protein HOA93_02215 [bacterium]|nr:hypothetical protein [bacterium]
MHVQNHIESSETFLIDNLNISRICFFISSNSSGKFSLYLKFSINFLLSLSDFFVSVKIVAMLL